MKVTKSHAYLYSNTIKILHNLKMSYMISLENSVWISMTSQQVKRIFLIVISLFSYFSSFYILYFYTLPTGIIDFIVTNNFSKNIHDIKYVASKKRSLLICGLRTVHTCLKRLWVLFVLRKFRRFQTLTHQIVFLRLLFLF